MTVWSAESVLVTVTVAPAGTVTGPENAKLAIVMVPADIGEDEVTDGAGEPEELAEPAEPDVPDEHAATVTSSVAATPETSAVRFIQMTRPGSGGGSSPGGCEEVPREHSQCHHAVLWRGGGELNRTRRPCVSLVWTSRARTRSASDRSMRTMPARCSGTSSN
ncbi:hypothetical protein GCM10009839_03680 [Catenulispora yoronensis]|uniref:Secreted protein n=1 Tax=Catenulispora yoronensis TaxID=450799 RepID=A0ABN2TKE9_9ACTN